MNLNAKVALPYSRASTLLSACDNKEKHINPS